MFVISEVSYQDATSALNSLGERAIARNRLNQVAKSLLDAETGQRGYLLTNRQEYLNPYRDAQDGLHESTEWLKTYYAGDPQKAQLMHQLAAAVDEKMSELATSIELHDKGAHQGWRDLLLSDIGKEKMERVRTLTEQLLAEEGTQVAKGRKGVYQTLMLNRIGTTAMAAVSLLALFMYLRQTATLERHTDEEARRIESERDRLEAEVTARTRQLKELAQHLQTIREDERSRLARELHDELGALLTAAKLDAARLKSRLGKTTTPEILERLAHLNETLNGGIALKRRIIEDLRPSSLSNLGLVAALEILIREFGQRSEVAAERRARARRPQSGGAAHRLPSGPGGADQRRQVRQGHRGQGDARRHRRRTRPGRRPGRRRRLRFDDASRRDPWTDRHALPGGGRGRLDAPGVDAGQRHLDRGDSSGDRHRFAGGDDPSAGGNAGVSARPTCGPASCRLRPTPAGLLPRQGRARVPYRPRTRCHGH